MMTAPYGYCICCDRELRQFTCRNCGETFLRHHASGPKPRYCTSLCKSRAYDKRKKMKSASGTAGS